MADSDQRVPAAAAPPPPLDDDEPTEVHVVRSLACVLVSPHAGRGRHDARLALTLRRPLDPCGRAPGRPDPARTDRHTRARACHQSHQRRCARGGVCDQGRQRRRACGGVGDQGGCCCCYFHQRFHQRQYCYCCYCCCCCCHQRYCQEQPTQWPSQGRASRAAARRPTVAATHAQGRNYAPPGQPPVSTRPRSPSLTSRVRWDWREDACAHLTVQCVAYSCGTTSS